MLGNLKTDNCGRTYRTRLFMNHLKPYAYLTYILDELRKMGAFPKEEELKKLLPWSEDLPEYCRTKLKK